MGYLWKVEAHLAENNLEQHYSLVQNGGKLHVVIGHRTYDLFGARAAPGGSGAAFTLSENRRHLDHYRISSEVAATWMAEAQAQAGLQ